MTNIFTCLFSQLYLKYYCDKFIFSSKATKICQYNGLYFSSIFMNHCATLMYSKYLLGDCLPVLNEANEILNMTVVLRTQKNKINYTRNMTQSQFSLASDNDDKGEYILKTSKKNKSRGTILNISKYNFSGNGQIFQSPTCLHCENPNQIPAPTKTIQHQGLLS